MELYSKLTDLLENILHKDGIAIYYEEVLSLKNADCYLSNLLSKIEWKNDEEIIFGNQITTKRKVTWYADELFKYTYSNHTKLALPWVEELLELKK